MIAKLFLEEMQFYNHVYTDVYENHNDYSFKLYMLEWGNGKITSQIQRSTKPNYIIFISHMYNFEKTNVQQTALPIDKGMELQF